MLASARRRYLITGLVAVAACKQDASRPAAHEHPAPATAPADAAGAPAGGGNRLKITISDKKPRGSALAKRCTLDGDPLVGECIGGGTGIALDARGMLYVVDGKQVRRYTRSDADAGCHYVLAGEPIALPADNPRPQELGKGPVYMRSGGAAWHLTASASGDAIYAHDFLGGMVRIDRGKAEPACLDVFGYDSVAANGKDLLISRHGIEKLALGKHCTAKSAHIDDKARGQIVVANGKVHVATFHALTRYDGTTPTPLGDGSKICAVSSVARCGDDSVCVMDTNCMHVIQFGADGKLTRDLESDVLFDDRPWSLNDATTRADGAVLVYARHRDTSGGKEVCEGAVYELPAALFAL
jgi:hypothetical protein